MSDVDEAARTMTGLVRSRAVIETGYHDGGLLTSSIRSRTSLFHSDRPHIIILTVDITLIKHEREDNVASPVIINSIASLCLADCWPFLHNIFCVKAHMIYTMATLVTSIMYIYIQCRKAKLAHGKLS